MRTNFKSSLSNVEGLSKLVPKVCQERGLLPSRIIYKKVLGNIWGGVSDAMETGHQISLNH
jgi:hypothetical protein